MSTSRGAASVRPFTGPVRAGLVPLRALCLALCLILPLALVSGCAKKPAPQPMPPRVALAETPQFFADHLHPAGQELDSWKEMAPTIRKSLNYTERRDPDDIAVSRQGLTVTWGELADSLRELRALLPELDKNPGLLLERFRWVEVSGGIAYSGYYQPLIRASRTKKGPYTQAIYAKPPELDSYRRRHGRFHSREAIDGPRQVLAGRGLELAWADPVDVYFLQIQGSGKLVFDDDTTAYLNYDGQNGHKYRASGRIIRELGWKLNRGDVLEQRAFFKKYPERQHPVFFQNPSYVFFRYSTRGATGAINEQVDDWLSLATDRRFLPLGGIIAYGVNIPDRKEGTIPLRGLGFAQDTGGAIKRNRIDVYCGDTERANYVASFLDAKGPAWLLLKRDAPKDSAGGGAKDARAAAKDAGRSS
ncbi:MAG: MltA domain-containing protein [Desulfovibrionaceae bacterium]|nr:MltA domain-containing protein [Desulfovibrionaceae bacterium]